VSFERSDDFEIDYESIVVDTPFSNTSAKVHHHCLELLEEKKNRSERRMQTGLEGKGDATKNATHRQ
jgi:hypothetical protein